MGYSLKKSPHDQGVNKEKIPQGFYTFQITDFKVKDKEGRDLVTKNGDPRIMAICEVVDDVKHEGKSCVHSVIIYQPKSPSIKGIGITRHFLKCIGEPWEGDLDINPENWIGKQFKAEVIHNGEYVNLVELQEGDQHHISETKDEKVKQGEIAWDDDIK